MEDFKKPTKPKKKSAAPAIAVLIVALIASVAVAQHRDPPSKAVETETVTSAEETTSVTIDPKDMLGRGLSDSGRDEPNYVGISGYIAIGTAEKSEMRNSENDEAVCQIPIYDCNGEEYTEIGRVDNNTEIIVKSQSLSHAGWGAYHGYLLVSDNSGSEFYINVNNFVTMPYYY